MNYKSSCPSPVTYIHKLTTSLLIPLILFASALFPLCLVTVPANAQSQTARTNTPLSPPTQALLGCPEGGMEVCVHATPPAASLEDSEGAKKQEVLSQYGKVPAFFIENKGQTAKEVKYYFKGNDSVYFTDEGVVFRKISRYQESEGLESQSEESRLETQDLKPATYDSLAYRLEFAGAKPTSPQARNVLKAKMNYFIGNNRSKWHSDISTYQDIVYPKLYEGIDVVYKGVPGGMKYEFIVQPGADPNVIRLAYTGIEGLIIDGTGNLIIHTALGDVRDAKPYCYQEIDGKEVEVGCNFVIRNGECGVRNAGMKSAIAAFGIIPKSEIRNPKWEYGFEIASYNKNYLLIIDPGLEYSTFLGGSSSEWGFALAVDGLGNAYATGFTTSTDFPPTLGAYDANHNGGFDAFVTKLAPAGSGTSDLLYSTFLGGSGSANDVCYGIVVDGSGNVYVVGLTFSSDFPTTLGAYDTSYNGSGDAFMVKLNPANSGASDLLYSTFLGGSDLDVNEDIAVDDSGNAYVTGGTRSPNFPTTPGAYDTSFNGIHDAFVVKLATTGLGASDLLYSTFLGGSDLDVAIDITMDGSGNAYVTGGTRSSNFPITIGAYDTSYNGNEDAFMVKLNPAGSGSLDLLYSTFLGGSGGDFGNSIAVDGSRNAYVTGFTFSADFPTTTGTYDTSFNGIRDVFVTKLTPSGSGASDLLYSTFLGGTTFDEGFNIAVDGSRNAYVTGFTFSTDFPTTTGAFDTSYNGEADAFVTKLDSTGSNLLYSTFLGGSGEDVGADMGVDGSGNAYVVGRTFSADFPTTPGAYDTSFNGIHDVFVAKLDAISASICKCPAGGPTGCISGRVTNHAGEPLAGKVVKFRGKIFPGGSRIRMKTQTDDDGCYQFNLLEGIGKIKVGRCRGGGRQIVIIEGGAKVNDVNFRCK